MKNYISSQKVPMLEKIGYSMGDVADFSEWKNKRRATGFCFAGIVFALKAGLGVGGAICGIIVAAFGFVSNTVQTEHSLLGIRLTSSIILAITFALSTSALFFYPITKKFNIKMQAELEERRKNQN